VTSPAVLVVEHEASTPAAWLGEWLESDGVALDVRRPYAGEPLPDDLAEHRGLLVLGGSMDSWDDAGFRWLPQARALVRDAEERTVPALGICLGHQIAAAALGGRVGRNPAGGTLAVVEVGWDTGAAEDPLLGPLGDATVAVHWNDDVVLELPAGATRLATSPDGAVQAARLGRSVWGVQFHPELGPELLEEWIAEGGAPYHEQGLDLAAFLADVRRWEPELRRSWRGLATSFAALLRTGDPE
jgi:GMP synthase (glutamine-hydrolysing)